MRGFTIFFSTVTLVVIATISNFIYWESPPLSLASILLVLFAVMHMYAVGQKTPDPDPQQYFAPARDPLGWRLFENMYLAALFFIFLKSFWNLTDNPGLTPEEHVREAFMYGIGSVIATLTLGTIIKKTSLRKLLEY